MPQASGAPVAQHCRAAHRCPPATPGPTWHPSCASPPYMAPGRNRHPCQHALHARACKYATCAYTHTCCYPLPRMCPGTGLLQHRDTVTSETQEHSCACTPLSQDILAGAHLWMQLLWHIHACSAAHTLVCTHCHKHTCSPQLTPASMGASLGTTCSAGVQADSTSLPGPLSRDATWCHQPCCPLHPQMLTMPREPCGRVAVPGLHCG